jgi:hypothetical protein
MSFYNQPYHHRRIKKTIHTSLLISFLFLFILLNSCTTSYFSEKMDQGDVTFDIAYTNNSGRSFPIQLLPKTIDMKFNNNFASYTLEDRVGLFSISNIIDLLKHENITLIKVFDKKYVYRGGRNDSPLFFKNNTTYDVKLLSDTQRLAGVLCKTANMVNPETKLSFNILYSSSIKVGDLNENTPYGKINGLLLQFGIQMKNLDMKLTAKKVEQKEIKDQEFSIPEGYKHISKSQMEDIINTLLP